MALNSFYKDTITPYTITPGTSFPYEETETVGATFKAAFDTISGNENMFNSQYVTQATHWIAFPSSVTLTDAMTVARDGVKYRVIYVDPVALKSGHHKEALLKEIP